MDNVDWKSRVFDKCIDSWFGRHKSTEEMQQGSANEEFILQRIKTNDWVHDVFEIGMLQTTRGGPWLAVSPDAIALGNIESSDGRFQEDEEQVIFVEMKTRQKPAPIQRAFAARDKYGAVVYCNYGDDSFNECVPPENKKQLVQEAMVKI